MLSWLPLLLKGTRALSPPICDGVLVGSRSSQPASERASERMSQMCCSLTGQAAFLAQLAAARAHACWCVAAAAAVASSSSAALTLPIYSSCFLTMTA